MRGTGRRRHDAGPAGAAGFTLVELLVALTLIGLLSVMLFGGLRFGARSWEAAATASEARDRVAATQGFLRDRLGQATLPGPEQSRAAFAAVAIAGRADRLAFTAPWLTALAPGGLYRFALWHDADAAPGGALMLAWEPARPPQDGDAAPPGELAGRRVLLDGVRRLAVAYYGIAADEGEARWHQTWSETDGLPLLLGISVGFHDPTRRWPAMQIRPPR